MNKTRLNDIFPQAGISRNGVFAHLYNALSNEQRPAWLTDVSAALQLDRVFSGRYGRQIISPFLEQYLIDGMITENDAQMMATDCYNIHAVQWNRKYNLLSLEYNPIANYDMTETENTESETSGATSSDTTGGGYSQTSNSATGTITETIGESGQRKLETLKEGAETDTLTKAGTETHETLYQGERRLQLDKIGAERTIESWNASQRVTTSESGTETEKRDVYAFNSTDYDNANKTEKSFAGRETEVTTTLPEHTTETAQRDRSDTTKETFNGRKDTVTDSYANRTDSNVKSFNARKDTETESYTDRQTLRTTDDSGHTATQRYDNHLTDSVSGEHSESGNVTRTLTRRGNIGVTTTQQMAKSEIALWQWNFYYDVMSDLRKDLTTGAY